MPEELTLYEGGLLAKADEELLWERVGSHYLELQEKRPGKRVKVADAVQAVLDAHPGEYVEAVATAACKGKDFESYLASRRKEYLLASLVPTLYAAELGSRMGAKAAERLMERLESGDDIDTKDLLAIVKAGYDLAAKVDKQVEEVIGPQKVEVTFDAKALFMAATPEQLLELSRRYAVESK